MGKRLQNRLETQATIFDAAVELFESQGYDNTTVEEICRAADVGRATFFRHFETKAGLIREHNRRLTEDARRRLDDLDASGSPYRLGVVADAIHDAWIGVGPGRCRLGTDASALSDPTGRRTHPELLDLVLEIVRRGRTEGDLHSRLPPPLTAYLVVTHLAGAAAWWFTHPDDDLRELLDNALEQCLGGIGAERSVV